MKKSLLVLAVISGLSATAQASVDADKALNALQASVSAAEQVIASVSAQESLNQLAASVAEAELLLSIAYADDSIRAVRGQEALNSLTASVADAELTIAVADSIEAINAVSDSQMLAELDDVLQNTPDAAANDLIVAVVSERPVLASAIQDMATDAGFSEALVATAIMGGLSNAEATAAGK
jgi:hypothetical protein